MKKLLLLLLLALPLSAQFRNPLTRGLADLLYVKLAGSDVVLGTVTFTNLVVTGTCTGCGSSSSLGDFVGPSSATPNALVRFDGATGKLGKDSPVIVSDAGAVTGVVSLDSIALNGGAGSAFTLGASSLLVLGASSTVNVTANRTMSVTGNATVGQGTYSGTNTGDDVAPVNTTSTASNWFSAYDNTTGIFTKSRPACADLSNAVASCSTDTTSASNISSGTLAAARGGAGTITGALKANGSGVVSQAACADLSNASALCSSTDAANLSGAIAAARMPAFTGDATTSAGAVALTFATVNSNVGSFTNASLTVNGKGLVTAASSGTSGANAALSNLASVAINTDLVTGAGTAANFTATAPAQTSASQAGVNATVTASAAVDGSSAHAAANGGNVVLVPGAAVNSGTTGLVLAGATGTGTFEAGTFGSPSGTDMLVGPLGGNTLRFRNNGSTVLSLSSGALSPSNLSGPTIGTTGNAFLQAFVGTYTIVAPDGSSGAQSNETIKREVLTLSLAATGTDTSANLVSAATTEVESIVYRITTTIATSTAFTVSVKGGNAFCSIGTATTSQSTLTSGTTGVLVPCAYTDRFYAAASKLTVTVTGIATAGVIELEVIQKGYVAPTS